MLENLEQLRVFYYVAKNSSITLASQKLFISQPAVSQSIQQLEKSCGCQLFRRSSKGVRLTPEGIVLQGYVDKAFQNLYEGEKKLNEMLNFEKGEIRIGASDMTLRFFLLEYIEAFHKKYPNIKITVSNAPTPETIVSLKTGKIDFGVVSAPVPISDDYIINPLTDLSDVFVASERFSELKNKIILFKELEQLPIICLEENTSTRKYIDTFLKDKDIVLKPEFELATSDLIVEFAMRNMGIGSVVRNFAQKQLQDGNLFELQLEESIPERKICLISSTKNIISLSAQQMLNMII